MAGPEIQIGDATDFSARNKNAFPLFVRLMHFKRAGDEEPAHTHHDGHFVAVLRGRVRLMGNDGRPVEKTWPELVWIDAGVPHQLTALEDDTICACLHDKRAFAGL